MLTAFQVERVAYAPAEDFYGEFLCRRCVLGEVDANGGDSELVDDMNWDQDDAYVLEYAGYEAWSRFSVDEFDASQSQDMGDGHEECGCTMGVNCTNCGGEIVEAFYDDYEHQA